MTRKASGDSLQKRIHDLRPFLADLRFALDDPDDDPDDDDKGDDEVDKGASGTGTDVDKDVKDPDKKRLSDEAKRHRLEAKDFKKQLDEALAKLKGIEDQDKSELEKATAAIAERDERLEKQATALREKTLRLAFYEAGVAAQFKNPRRALRLLELDELEVDDEGNVDEDKVKSLAEALLKSDPYLAADGSEGSGSTKDQSGGTPSNGRKNKTKDDAALVKKFPALASRG